MVWNLRCTKSNMLANISDYVHVQHTLLFRIKQSKAHSCKVYQILYSTHPNTLVQWNVIMYANVTFPLTLVSSKLNAPFFSTLFQWGKNWNCFQMYIWRNCAKIVCDFFEIVTHKTLTRTNIPALSWISVLQNHNYTVTNVDQICRWSAISLPLVTHTENTVLLAWSSDSCSGGFVWNQLPRVGIITWSNDVITVPAYKHRP